DLDLLLYGQTVMSSPELTLPHPEMHERRFVLEPLAEVAPEMVHPALGLTVQEMLQAVLERQA
ncbi:MAG: 2-amino-4-hydroxy-6-hydroxymethyldihydropteridine diphosphokinase, partial [Edaphobacter sp.]